ncbi:MAG: PAS domain S-box protein [Kofleriaceae bacterium]
MSVPEPDPRRGVNREMFRLLVESVKDYAIFMLDTSGHVATWNIGAQRIKGFSADEIVGKHFSTFYPADDVAAGKCERELEGAARDGRFEDVGWRVRRDGTRFWANVVISAMRDDTGTLVGFSKVTRDLTERKVAEEEQLARLSAEERFRLLVESVHDYALYMLDHEGNVATWNIGAQRITGYSADEILGNHMSVFYVDSDVHAGRCENELDHAIREGRCFEEGWRVRKDGTQFWASITLTTIRDRTGMLVGFANVTRDLTDRKRAQDEQTARLAAEQANRAKDEFLAMLGHELRNPLAPILTALQLMKLRGDDKSSKEQQIIERQVMHMIHLVDDLLDIARITRGKIELRRQRLDIRGILAKAVEVASPMMEQRHQHFESATPSHPVIAEVDDARLTQVFANLVTNASKYTPKGGHVFVSVRVGSGKLCVDVRDDGIGIDGELLPRVFDLFVQGRQTAARPAGGLGLGLTLVRTLVELHHGTVAARSDGLGKGSTFTVTLPLADGVVEPRSPMISTPTNLTTNPQRILVVDDNDDARMLLGEALIAVGHLVHTAADAVEALEAARTFKPTIAVLDLGLPVMDGYELAEHLQNTPAAERPRLIALTGYGQDGDRARTAKAGFDVHLVKPVDVKRLLESITELSATP